MSMSRLATLLLAHARGCPRGARHRLWILTVVLGMLASQVEYSLTRSIPGPGAISLVLELVLVTASAALLFTRVLIPLERAIVAAQTLAPSPVPAV